VTSKKKKKISAYQVTPKYYLKDILHKTKKNNDNVKMNEEMGCYRLKPFNIPLENSIIIFLSKND